MNGGMCFRTELPYIYGSAGNRVPVSSTNGAESKHGMQQGAGGRMRS